MARGANLRWWWLAALLALGCPTGDDDAGDDDAGDDDTAAQPAEAVHGTIEVQNSAGRSGSYYLPEGYNLGPLPMLVGFHGTGGSGEDMVGAFALLADEWSFLLWQLGELEEPEEE